MCVHVADGHATLRLGVGLIWRNNNKRREQGKVERVGKGGISASAVLVCGLYNKGACEETHTPAEHSLCFISASVLFPPPLFPSVLSAAF